MELKGTLCEFESIDNYRHVGFLNEVKSKIALIHIHGMGSFFWNGDIVFKACNKQELDAF